MPQLTMEAHSEAQVALERAREHLLSLQDERGLVARASCRRTSRWTPRTCSCASSSASAGADETERSAAWIRSQQRADGTWANFHGGPGELSTTIEAYWALRLAGDSPEDAHMRAAAEFVRARGRPRARARVHAPVAGAVRAVVVGSGAGAAAGDRPAALVGAAERLRLRLLGAPDDRRAVARQSPPAGAPAAVRPGRAARARSAGRASAARPGAAVAPPCWLLAPGSAAARLRAPAARAAAPARARPRRALDRAPPGGRRLVGRHPAAVGLLADGAAPRAATRSSTP